VTIQLVDEAVASADRSAISKRHGLGLIASSLGTTASTSTPRSVSSPRTTVTRGATRPSSTSVDAFCSALERTTQADGRATSATARPSAPSRSTRSGRRLTHTR